MKRITIISFFLGLLLSNCALIRQYRYMSKAKAPKGTFRAEIPFELKNGLVVIKVKLNGSEKEFEFILDSGAPISVIYRAPLEDSKAKTVMNYPVHDSQGNATNCDYVLLDMAIGNLQFKDIFAAYSADPNEHVSCIAAGGLIGADLMQTANWHMDFAAKKIVITDLKKSSMPDLKDYQKVSCSKRAPFSSMPWFTVLPGLTVDMKVNGTVFKDVLIDLGAGASILLPKNAVTTELFKNEPKEVAMGFSSFGLLGAEMDTTFYYTSSDVYIDQLHLNKYSINVGKKNLALVGMGFFADYTMFFDFRKTTLYFKPVVKEKNTVDERGFGFYLNYDSKNKSCYVGSLYEGSAAFKAGLQLNDTILEIDNTKIPVFNEYCEFRNWLLALPSQDLVMLKTRRTAEAIKVEKALIPKR